MPSPGDTLSARALNRALLARQGLLERVESAPEEMLERLVGMQNQVPLDPYLALWSRVRGFDPGPLGALVEEREVVRMPLMRGTVHMATARDALTLRALVEPVIARMFKGSPFSKQIAGVDHGELRAATRELVEAEPRTRAELGRLLAERHPGIDASPLGYAATYLEPMVQVPPRGVWGKTGQARWTTASSWLGEPVPSSASRAELVRRYLAAFGPASVRDIQNWSGLTRLREVFDELRGELRVFRDESGTELFDVPGAPLPDPDTPAPPRVLPNYDNVLLGHHDRSRIVPSAPASPMLPGHEGDRGSVLVGGYFAGMWKRERAGRDVTMRIELGWPLAKREERALRQEAERALAFVEPKALTRTVAITCRA